MAPEGTMAAFEDRPALRLQGEAFTLPVLPLVDLREPGLLQSLLQEIARAPYFFRHAPVVLDMLGLSRFDRQDFCDLVACLRDCQLVPVGVRNGTEEQNQAAVALGLSVVPMWRTGGAREPTSGTAEQQAEQDEADGAAAAPIPTDPAPTDRALAAPASSVMISEPIRCGQQMRAPEGDLIALTTVSTGAELHARGHIHVYGALRGRAFAGCDGDKDARIFCRCFEPELVSIADQWLVREDIEDHLIGQSVQICLIGRRLIIEPVP